MAGRVMYALAFVAGCTLIAVVTYKQIPFVATLMQFAVVGVLIIALCVTALKLPKPPSMKETKRPNIVLLFLVGFVLGSVFMVSRSEAQAALHLSPVSVVALLLGLEALIVTFLVTQTRGGPWDERRRFALLAGAFMVYVWIGFMTDISLHGKGDLPAHSVLAALACVLLAVVGFRVFRGSTRIITDP